MRRNAGFTLLELVLVLVLLSVISAIFTAHFPKLDFTLEGGPTECESRIREAVVYARNQQLLRRDAQTNLIIEKTGATLEYESKSSVLGSIVKERRTFKWTDAEVPSDTPVELSFDSYGRRCSKSCTPKIIVIRPKDGTNDISLTIYETGYVGRTKS